MFLSETEWIVLGLVLAGFTVQGATGFGAGIVSLSLSALFVPLDKMLPTFIPLALLIAVTLTIKERKSVQAGVLFKRVIPGVLPGGALGLLIFSLLDVGTLLPFFGALAVCLGVFEGIKTFRTAEPAPLNPVASAALLGAGGVAHGMFASGGPLIVLALSRLVDDKRAFRATVSAMWVMVNGVILATYFWQGLITMESARLTGILLPAVGGGLVLGELVIRFLPEIWFRRVVLLIVSIAGALLVIRAL